MISPLSTKRPRMQLYAKVIKEVEQSPAGPQIGAFFDFDGTIIYGYSATTYLREQIKRGDVKPGQLPQLVATMSKFALGNMGFSAMMTEASGYLAGTEEKEYIEFGEQLYNKHIAKLVYPESRALVEAHLRKGHTVALVSAATPYQVTPAANELGIKHVMCTHMEVVDGKFTGEVVRPTCYGMGKVDAAETLIEKYRIDPEQSYFYSDSDEDIQLLEFVGKPRPLNPNSRLRGIAKGRGWPVQDFTSRGSTGIRDYIRTFATQSSMVTSFLAGLPIYALTGSMQKTRNFSISLFADTACAIAGIELDVTGEEHIWANRPCVFIFNHQSQADTIIVPALLRRDMAGVGKKEIADVPILGKLMQFGGTVLIDRENTASAVEAMKPLVEVMQKEGRSVCLAPEGTRSTSTNLGRFKKGAFHLAMQAGVPIVPIVIHNAIDVAHRGEYVMRPATVKVTVLPAVATGTWSVQNMNQQVDEVRDMFLEELDQMELQRPELKLVETGKTEKTSETEAENAVKPSTSVNKTKAKKTKTRKILSGESKVTRTPAKGKPQKKSTASKADRQAKSKVIKSRASVSSTKKTRKAKPKPMVKVSARVANEALSKELYATPAARKSVKKSVAKKKLAGKANPALLKPERAAAGKANPALLKRKRAAAGKTAKSKLVRAKSTRQSTRTGQA